MELRLYMGMGKGMGEQHQFAVDIRSNDPSAPMKTVVWRFNAGARAAPIGEQATVPPPAGRPAPGFDLSLLSGEKVALKEFRGKAVLIVFWQSG